MSCYARCVSETFPERERAGHVAGREVCEANRVFLDKESARTPLEFGLFSFDQCDEGNTLVQLSHIVRAKV